MADFVKFKKDNKVTKPRRTINFKSIFLLLLLIFILSSIISSIMYALTPKIAVVPINGVISTEKSTSIYGDTISSREIADILNGLETDTSVKAVLIDINSPGGSPVASDEIAIAIESLKQTKPVYALVNDVGASGAYWVAVQTDKIYASPYSILGSIGVTSAGLGFEQLIADYNITYRRQVSGTYKDMGTPFREPTKEENEMLQEILDDIHYNFIKHVSTQRNISVEDLKPLAQGQVFLGERALGLNLIDKIGYYPDAIKDLKEAADSPSAVAIDYGPEPTFAESLGLNSILQLPSTKSQILLE